MLRSSIAAIARVVFLAFMLASPVAHAQRLYGTPELAADALVKAIRDDDAKGLETVLGNEWKRFIPNDELSRKDADAFLVGWDKQHKFQREDDATVLLTVGEDPGFTLPIPIVKNKAALWKFDVISGAERLRTARIGRNELAAIQATLAYCDAQREYASQDRSGEGVLEYARKLVSSPGARDGLYWPSPLDIDQSPLGPLIARQPPKGPGYWGYHYKILTEQGRNAPGGAYDYIIGGRMRAGFALVAWPVRYGDTGVMTFVVSHAGIVYERDLGPNTSSEAQRMVKFDPDARWHKAAP